MFQFHYHFAETSLVDILQLFISALGFAGLLVTLWQTQKNITLQIRSARNSQRPLFDIATKIISRHSTGEEALLEVQLTVRNNAANNFRVETVEVLPIRWTAYG